ncbi:hypothetical protein HWV62_12916 [Athelia sp. TMB]|nr:hypothetical protein HWV62_12916 [Athelia sp. TMB]
MRVRIIRQSLSWATWLRTANLFDWHLAPLLHKKADRVKIQRWTDFDYKDLLKGSDLRCEITKEGLAGEVDALWFRPAAGVKVDKKKVLLYIHGGGYVVQCYDDPLYYALTARFAKTFNIDVLSVDYRASASEPFPYCLQDTISAYRYLTLEKGYKPEDVTIGGDSAGGNLALATIRYLNEYHDLSLGLSLPGRLFLLSPWTDLTIAGALDPAAQIKAKTDYVPILMGMTGATQHTGTLPHEYERRKHPYISPFFADFTAFKATSLQIHVTYGTAELMDAEIEIFVKKLQTEVGVDRVNVCIAEDAVHDHQLVFPELKVSDASFKAQARWFSGGATEASVRVRY